MLSASISALPSIKGILNLAHVLQGRGREIRSLEVRKTLDFIELSLPVFTKDRTSTSAIANTTARGRDSFPLLVSEPYGYKSR
jgi:hypothetical protein